MPGEVYIGTDVALMGRDQTYGIVGVHLDRQAEDSLQSQVCIYRREQDTDRLVVEREPFYPFFFLADIRLLRDFPRERFRFQELKGDNYFKFLVIFQTQRAYWDAMRHIKNSSDRTERLPETIYRIASPAMQYLMQTGRTLFKGLSFDQLHRMQIDIEVTSDHAFPNAKRASDQIIIIAMSDNRGWSKLIDGTKLSEKEMLQELVETIVEQDPDVLEGHNCFAFDFPYIAERCTRHQVSFAIGRDGSVPRTFDSSIRFAERVVDFPALDIAGRHVVDTYFQVMSYDVFKRNMTGYGLKQAARYFGFASPDRTYIEGDRIAEVWKENPQLVLAYALDDVIETERLARHLSGSTFYLTQMVPMAYGQVARTGPAAKIEALFVREYLRQKHALPRSEWGSQALGGYTDVFITGVVGPVVYADVESLYPSIMLNYDIKPKQDHLNLFQDLLRRLTDLRFDAKRRMTTATSEEQRSELDARQTSYKNLINSFYGSLGFSLAIFNDFAEADRVAATGQDILRKMIYEIQKAGGSVIEVDTDGVLFIPPDLIKGEEEERRFVDRISSAMPEGIRIGFDGRYRKMLSYKKKNYALQRYEGGIKFKGSSLVSRSSERFGRAFVRKAIKLLLEEDIDGLHELYLETAESIRRHDWTVDDFSRTETLKDTLDAYRADVTAGRRSRAASYELAIERARRTGRPTRKGDRVSYYITGLGAGVKSFEQARWADEWNTEEPDENTQFYLKRLVEFTRKFEPFFTERDFQEVFPPDSYGQINLFGSSLSNIRLQTHETKPDIKTEEIPF